MAPAKLKRKKGRLKGARSEAAAGAAAFRHWRKVHIAKLCMVLSRWDQPQFPLHTYINTQNRAATHIYLNWWQQTLLDLNALVVHKEQ